jgi:hypothetical protein
LRRSADTAFTARHAALEFESLERVNDVGGEARPNVVLFATGIGGLGLLGWRRKRKAAA